MANGRLWLMAALGVRPTNGSRDLYTDLSDYLRAESGSDWSYSRGRQAVTGKMNAGQGTFLLDNRRLYFEQLNTDSPFAPHIVPECPIKAGMEWPWLPGQLDDGAFRKGISGWTGDSASTAHLPPIDDLAQGALRTSSSGIGTHGATSPIVAVPAAEIGQLVTASGRARYLSGNFGNTVRVQISFYSDAGGTALISTTSGPATTLIAGNPSNRISAQATIPAGTLSLRIRYQRLGTISTGSQTEWKSAVVDWTDQDIMQDHFTGYADSWVCTGDVGDNTCVLSVTDNFGKLGTRQLNTPKYGAYLATLNATKWYRLGESVRQQSDVRNLNFKDEITGLRDASIDQTLNPSQVVVGLVPVGFGFVPILWPVFNQSSFVGNGPLAGVDGSSPLDPDFGFSFTGPSSYDAGCIRLPSSAMPEGHTWAYAMWVRSDDGRIFFNEAQYVDAPVGYNFDLIRIGQGKSEQFGSAPASPYTTFVATLLANSGYLQYTLYNSDYSYSISATAAQNIVVDSLWHLLVFKYDGTTLSCYIDGHSDSSVSGSTIDFPSDNTGGPGGLLGEPWSLSGLSATTNYGVSPGVDIDNGTPSDIQDIAWNMEMDEFLFWNGSLPSDAIILAMYANAKIAYPVETVSQRFAKVMADSNWSLYDTVIGPGVETQVTAITELFSKANPLTYAQLLEDADQGLLFATRPGNIRLVTHRALVDAASIYSTPAYTLSNEPGNFVPYEAPGASSANNKDLLYTQAVVNIIGGNGQFADDLAAQAVYDIRTYDSVRDLPLDDDERALFIAEWLVAVFATPGTKLKSVIVNPYANSTALQMVRDTSIGQAIAIRHRPPGVQHAPSAAPSGYFTIVAQVQGIRGSGSRNNCRIAYDLDSTYSTRWMQFGDNFGSYDMAL